MLHLLSIENLSVTFGAGTTATEAVKNISLSLQQGELLAVVGESGSGKSVTALSILGLLPGARYPSGQILFTDGEKVIDLLQQPDLRKIRGNRIAMIFQEPMTSLNPVMRCGRQIMEALLAHKSITATEARKQTISWLEKVKLPQPEKIFDRYPHQLSGGQKQRVMIAMALCCQPVLLICDEPTTALDVTVQKSILDLIRELQQQLHMAVLFITHDLGVVAAIADRVAIMYQGQIVEQNSAAQIFRNAQHPYTRALIDCRPALHPKGEKLPVVADFLREGKVEPTVSRAVSVPATNDGGTLVSVADLTVRYPAQTNFFGKPVAYFHAVQGVSFEIRKGATVGLVGESGCGKTTLGRTLLGLITPSSGSIVFNGVPLQRFSRGQLAAFRKNVQLVFQDPYSSLNPRLTIGDALSEPMRIHGIPAHQRRKKVKELLERVSLSPSSTGRYPHQFSGGQRQRIVIARALALEPSFLVCDESVSALDVSVQAQVLNLLNELKRELQLTLLFISHDLSVVRYMSDRIMVMQAGRIVESGPSEEVYQKPQSDDTKALLSAIPSLDFTRE